MDISFAVKFTLTIKFYLESREHVLHLKPSCWKVPRTLDGLDLAPSFRPFLLPRLVSLYENAFAKEIERIRARIAIILCTPLVREEMKREKQKGGNGDRECDEYTLVRKVNKN